jgi:hypothetical protein
MGKTSIFFSSGNCGDSDYEAVRDSPQAVKCKAFVEALWLDYEPYNNDPNFLSDAKNHFHQRFWEMYLCVTMLKRGMAIEKAGKEGPEFGVTINGKKVWFEAVAPGAGSGNDKVPAIEFGKAGSTPNEQILLRYTSALSEKLRKYSIDRKKEIVSAGDIYVVAVNGSKIPHAFFGSFLPYHVQAYLPIGYPTISIDRQTMKKVGEHFQYREAVSKKSGKPVSTLAFLDPAYSGISAVVHSALGVAGYTYGSARWGDDFEVPHNPLAVNGLPFDALDWCTYRYVQDDELKTVKPLPNSRDSSWITGGDAESFQRMKSTLDGPEWMRDPVGKALDEATKALAEATEKRL